MKKIRSSGHSGKMAQKGIQQKHRSKTGMREFFLEYSLDEQIMMINLQIAATVWVWILCFQCKSAAIGNLSILGYMDMFLLIVFIIIIMMLVYLGLNLNSKTASIIIACLMPFGILIIRYSWQEYMERYVIGVGVCMTMYLLAQVVSLFARKKGRRFKCLPKTLWRYLKKSIRMSACLLAFGCVFLSVQDIVCTAHRNLSIQNGVSKNINIVENHIFTSNRQIIEKFRQQCWIKMSERGREKACYELMELIMLYLTGEIDPKTKFIIGNVFNTCAGGQYSFSNNQIIADSSFMTAEYWEYAVNLVFHETYHWFERRLCEDGKSVDIRNLVTQNSIDCYKQEFENYITIQEDYDGYRNQMTESDAYRFAELGANQLIEIVKEL